MTLIIPEMGDPIFYHFPEPGGGKSRFLSIFEKKSLFKGYSKLPYGEPLHIHKSVRNCQDGGETHENDQKHRL